MEVKKAHDVVVLLASTTTPAGAVDSQGSAVRLPGMVSGFVFTLDVTAAATDAADTLDVKIQTKLDGSNWMDVVHFTQIVGNGGVKRYTAKILAATAQAEFEAAAALGAAAVRHLLGDEWRVKYDQADADADASFAFGVTGCPM